MRIRHLVSAVMICALTALVFPAAAVAQDDDATPLTKCKMKFNLKSWSALSGGETRTEA